MQSGSFRLLMQRGPTPGKTFELVKDVVTLGRDVSNDIVINDAEISRHHVRLTRQMGTFALEDLGSTNGTFVNSMRLAGQKLLSKSDVINLGETVTLTFEPTPPDMAATIVGSIGPVTMSSEPPPPRPAFAMPQMSTRPPEQAAPPIPKYQPEYQLPQSTPQAGSMDRRWVIAGVGCLVLCCCLGAVAAAVYYVDAYNLYCQIAPFLFACP
ncbi:MAG: FHA domain-containing protein [Chloroflexi bacterium]|nr:FHA domain-containing protein [Chloroflexota bacterium]